jgi:hypothetical protein
MAWDRYLSEVLGLRQLVLPADFFEDSASPDLSAVRILFLAEPQETPLSQREIFQKMVAAMKVKRDEIQVWEISAVDLATREKDISPDWIVVSFSRKLSDWLAAQRPRLILLTTYHPQACESDPSLKRPVWETLKTALEKSGLSTRLQS